MVIATNVAQLLLIILFLVFMLQRLDGQDLQWVVVFAPLWVSDLVTVTTGVHEIVRLLHPVSPEPIRRNLLITQLNRLKGTVCTACFKLLVVRRLSDPTDETPARLICIPFYVCAVGRLVLHLLKEKVPGPDPSSPPKRPGTPVNPLHIFVVLVACRVDGLNDLSWAATFWPTWILFGLLGLVLFAAGFLGAGMWLTGEPREHGQRALFLICYGVLLTVSVNGFAFNLNLSKRLDGDLSVTNAAIVAPLITAYASVLCFYLCFTFVLPRVVEHDLATLGERGEEEEDVRDGVLEAVSQQLAPPFLVQQSSTLFARVNSTMLHSFVASASRLEPKLPLSAVHPERRLSGGAGRPGQGADARGLEEGRGQQLGPMPPAARSGTRALSERSEARVEERADSEWQLSSVEHGPGAEAVGAAAGEGLLLHPVLSEFESLQLELELWLRSQAPPPQPFGGLRMVEGWSWELGGASDDAAAEAAALSEAPAAAADAVTSVAAPAAEGGDAAGADSAGSGPDAGLELAPSSPRDEPTPASPAADAAASARSARDLAGGQPAPLQPPRGQDAPAAAEPSASEPQAEAVPTSPTAIAVSEAGSPAGVVAAPAAPANAAHRRSRLGWAVGGRGREPSTSTVGQAPPAAAIVPPEILRKLHRFVELKRQIAAQIVSTTLLAPIGAASSALVKRQDEAAPAAASDALAASERPAAALRAPSGAQLTDASGAQLAGETAVTVVGAPSSEQTGARSEDGDGEMSEQSCWICCEGPRDAVFLECGHGGVCLACARRCFKKKGRLCPMCRQHIEQVVHINLWQAEHNGSRIVRVQESDPQILHNLSAQGLGASQ